LAETRVAHGTGISGLCAADPQRAESSHQRRSHWSFWSPRRARAQWRVAVGKFRGSGHDYLKSTRFAFRIGTTPAVRRDADTSSPTLGLRRAIFRQPRELPIAPVSSDRRRSGRSSSPERERRESSPGRRNQGARDEVQNRPGIYVAVLGARPLVGAGTPSGLGRKRARRRLGFPRIAFAKHKGRPASGGTVAERRIHSNSQARRVGLARRKHKRNREEQRAN
jgi:hypothetical protein